jgi:hypothetical protein
MHHKSRQVVLGLRVHEVLADVDPFNFQPPDQAHPALPAPPLLAPPHVPPTIGPPAIQFDTSSSFLMDQVFETRNALLKWVREVAVGLRFAIVIVNYDW